MAEVISGFGLGLFNTANTGVGQNNRGAHPVSIRVNSTTGNLVLQHQDEWLKAAGTDGHILRSYNSQDQGVGFRFRMNQRILLQTGELATAGSQLVRMDGSGIQTIYHWQQEQKRYISTAGAGAHDAIFLTEAGVWQWVEGSSGLTEQYKMTGDEGLLVARFNREGLGVQYIRNAEGQVSQIQDSQGQALILHYNEQGLLSSTQLKTKQGDQQQSQTRTYYQYDAKGRLTSTKIDLTPEDQSIEDQHIFETHYSYAGKSHRIAAIRQDDGTETQFTYQLIGDEYRLSQLIEGKGQTARTTNWQYDLANRHTRMIRLTPQGPQQTDFYFNAQV